MRLENLFSWTEHVDLDRWADDSEDPDAARVAEDLDQLTLSRTRLRKGGGLKLHLDLPPADVDDIPLGAGILLPEWDYRKQRLQDDFVSLQTFTPRDCQPQPLPARLRSSAQRLRRQFEHLRNDRQWLRQQTQGSELDLQAWLDFHVERQHGQCSERGLFMDQRQTRRDLACLLLADLSMSTDAHLNDEHRVIDVIRDSLLLFGETLSVLGDDFALYGFSPCAASRCACMNSRPSTSATTITPADGSRASSPVTTRAWARRSARPRNGWRAASGGANCCCCSVTANPMTWTCTKDATVWKTPARQCWKPGAKG